MLPHQTTGMNMISITELPSTEPIIERVLSQKSEKGDHCNCASHQKMGCVSQDIELPEPTVGLSTENLSILKKNGKISPRAHLELKFSKKEEIFPDDEND